ncbi:MAG TPA: HAMP domain-containing sensor histidine kinase [Candidatus Sulfotelmatobacter sp.]|nr:HAMP domain-containing sensor histidine kinase [Candidatus Sulfotelmatobacter sp.]
MTRVIKRNKWSSIFWISVIAGMASLVVMVAVLQYRWTKQLIEATEAGMGNSLRPLTIGWHLDFYGELSAICVALQVGPDSGAHDAWADYLQRYAKWSRQDIVPETPEVLNPSPGLVEEVYIWETSHRKAPRLLRLAPDQNKIVSAEVPKDLQPMLSRLQDAATSLPQALRAWEPSWASSVERSAAFRDVPSIGLPRWSSAMIGWQFDESIPAVVHPLLHHSQPYDSNSPVHRVAVDWMVVVLNVNTIRHRIIPNLTSRYFGGPEGLEYKLAVVKTGETPQVIYSSDSDFPSGDAAAVDSRMNIFGPSPDMEEGDFSNANNGEAAKRGNIFSGLVWFPVFQYGAQKEPWLLLLQHRTTPLQVIAADIWRRNMLTGGVVLLLLTIDMALIMIASRRAHNLAQLQLNFVASVSHELLTPLAAIYCTGQNAQDGLLLGKHDVVEHGSIITGQTRQLIDLVKEILMFASTDGGKKGYSMRPLTVGEIIQCVRKDVAVLVEGGGFTLEEQLDKEVPMVRGDLRALSHCLQNLIANAVKYSGSSRWIGISASQHDAGTHHQEVWISVRDRGVGIAASDLPHIFEPFYRGAKSVEDQIHGTGLGLAVAKRIAEAMGGKISVTSSVGMGSTFTLQLPIERRMEAKAEPHFALSQTT